MGVVCMGVDPGLGIGVQNGKGLVRGLLAMVRGVQVEMRMKIRQECTVILKEWAYVSLAGECTGEEV